MVSSWEAAWEIGFPATSVDEIELALVVRDLVHGSSYDVEAVDHGAELALDFQAGDELQDETYQLLLTAEVAGTDDHELVQSFAEELLEDLVDEARDLVDRGQQLGSKQLAELEFRPVPENEERWDLVIPDWLAPDDAVVPFGFMVFVSETNERWPDARQLDAHGRVVLVPFEGLVHAFGIPAPEGFEEDGEADGTLPIHPDGE